MDKKLKNILHHEYVDHIKKWIIIACAKGFPYIEKMCKMKIPMNKSHLAMQIAKIAKVII